MTEKIIFLERIGIINGQLSVTKKYNRNYAINLGYYFYNHI